MFVYLSLHISVLGLVLVEILFLRLDLLIEVVLNPTHLVEGLFKLFVLLLGDIQLLLLPRILLVELIKYGCHLPQLLRYEFLLFQLRIVFSLLDIFDSLLECLDLLLLGFILRPQLVLYLSEFLEPVVVPAVEICSHFCILFFQYFNLLGLPRLSSN